MFYIRRTKTCGQCQRWTYRVVAVRMLKVCSGPSFYYCTACHSFKIVAAQGMSRDRWDESLTWMVDRHNMPDVQGETGERSWTIWQVRSPSGESSADGNLRLSPSRHALNLRGGAGS